jgi:hypothetical protein
MYARQRVCFSRFFLFLVGCLFVFLGASEAGARHRNPPRTPLPTDNALSVSILVSATWQSLQNNAVRPMTLSAEISNYTLNETPSLDTLGSHQIAFEDITPEANWAVFAPQNDQFVFHFDIADTRGRLGKIVVKDLVAGTVLAQIAATADGSTLTGSLTGDWSTAYYQVEGYDRGGAVLFHLGLTQGNFDTYVPFPISSTFVPNRPAFVPGARNTTPDGMVGTEGNPYSVAGVITGSDGFSQGCGYRDKLNDKSTPDSIQPPVDFMRYFKHHKVLDSATLALADRNLKSGDPASIQAMITLLGNLTKEDPTPVMTNVDIVPYSDSTGHWHPYFTGAATAVYIIPYTRKTHDNGLLGILGNAFVRFLTPGAKLLSELGIDALHQFLMTPTGAPYGYIQGEIRPLGDVYMADAREAYKSSLQLPILQDVTFTLAPDIAPGGTGWGKIEMAIPTTTPAPPPPVFPLDLTFTSPGWTTTKGMSKGYKYKVSGNVMMPAGYQPVNQPVEFQVPEQPAVTLKCTLTVLLQLNINTFRSGTTGTNTSAAFFVKLKNSAGVFVAQGLSAAGTDGKFRFAAFGLAPGNYTAYTDQSDSGGKFSGSTLVIVAIGALQSQDLVATYTPNPPPPHP